MRFLRTGRWYCKNFDNWPGKDAEAKRQQKESNRWWLYLSLNNKTIRAEQTKWVFKIRISQWNVTTMVYLLKGATDNKWEVWRCRDWRYTCAELWIIAHNFQLNNLMIKKTLPEFGTAWIKTCVIFWKTGLLIWFSQQRRWANFSSDSVALLSGPKAHKYGLHICIFFDTESFSSYILT